METDGEREEKEDKLTARMRAYSKKPKEDRSGRISPEIGEEEVDMVIAVVDPGSIP
jgi:hypothetical protein